MLGDANPRDPSEAIKITVQVPGVDEPYEQTVRRGFLGEFLRITHGESSSLVGRQLTIAVTTAWSGDEPTVRVITRPV